MGDFLDTSFESHFSDELIRETNFRVKLHVTN
jgi:hypothetical protein